MRGDSLRGDVRRIYVIFIIVISQESTANKSPTEQKYFAERAMPIKQKCMLMFQCSLDDLSAETRGVLRYEK